MELSEQIITEFENPTPIEYNTIRNTTGWDKLDLKTIEKGLVNSLFSVCLYHNEKLVGIGRIIGDNSIYFYIQDIIVIPEYQGKGLGKLIMKKVMQYIDNNADNNSFIGLMAAEGVESFYNKLGFETRPTSRPGMYMINKKAK